jgi:ABC-type transport system substrate-binding protein
VRQAFVHATDREAFADVILRGYVSPALGGLVPPGVPGHSPDIGLRFDPDKARELLTQAGYPGGRGFPSVKFGYGDSWVDYTKYLPAQWRDNLGVDVASEVLPWPSYADTVREAPPPICLVGWVMDYPDPDNILGIGLQQYGKNLRLEEAFTTLVEKAGQSTHQEQRMAMYQEADRFLVEQAVVMPLAYGRNVFLLKPWVKRYPTSPIRGDFWDEVILEPH